MQVEENVSAKLKSSERDRAKELAELCESNGSLVVRAWREVFDRLPRNRQRAEIARVTRSSGAPYPRTGRGNRKARNRAA